MKSGDDLLLHAHFYVALTDILPQRKPYLYLHKLNWLYLRDHSFSMYTKFSIRLKFLTPPPPPPPPLPPRIHTRKYAYLGVNIAYGLNQWSLKRITLTSFEISSHGDLDLFRSLPRWMQDLFSKKIQQN